MSLITQARICSTVTQMSPTCTCGCAAEMLRYANFAFDRLDLRDLVQLQIGNVGTYSPNH